MADDLQILVYHVHLKNQLNLRRRRFLLSTYSSYTNYPLMTYRSAEQIHQGQQGYNKARADIKAMKSKIRKLRMKANAKFKWDTNCNIAEVIVDNQKLKRCFFEEIHDNYLAEQELLR